MKQKTSLLLVASASFAVGIAVDRLALSSGADSEGSGMPVSDGSSRKSLTNSRPGSSQTEPTSPGGNKSKQRGANDSRERRDKRFPSSVRQLFEQINDGQEINFAASSSLITAMPAGNERREAIRRFSSMWGRSDPQGALRWTENLDGREKFTAIDHILHEWASRDPASAADYAAQLSNSEQSLHVLHAITRRWAERDREAALTWSMSLDHPARRERAIGGVVSLWAQSQPAEAADFAASIESPFERRRVIEVAARRWANHDVSEAMAWARSLPGGDQTQATRSILREIAERNPAHAAELYGQVSSQLTNSQRRDREYRHMAHEVASLWSSTNPAEAAQWAVGLTAEGNIRREAVSAVTEHWLRLDRDAVSEWVGTLPQGDARLGATDRLVHEIAPTDPQTAFSWANGIGEEGHRINLLRHTLEQWQDIDPDAARSAFNSADLSPRARREVGEVLGIDSSAPAPGPATQETPEP